MHKDRQLISLDRFDRGPLNFKGPSRIPESCKLIKSYK